VGPSKGLQRHDIDFDLVFSIFECKNDISVAGICRNQAFAEMPRQLRKFMIFSYLIKNSSILGNLTPLKS